MSHFNLDLWMSVTLILPPILGILYSLYNVWWVSSVPLNGPRYWYGWQRSGLLDSLGADGEPEGLEDKIKSTHRISEAISDGSRAFLFQEYKYMFLYIIVFGTVIFALVDLGTTVAFLVGSLTSIGCGYIGMRIAVFSNIRTVHSTWWDLGTGYMTALRGGSVMAFCLVSIAILNLVILIAIYRLPYFYGRYSNGKLFEALAGYGLGGSSIALFGRVSGGIYTKAADIGADISGKNEYGLSEDDPRNPACIADNVGDNVGDIAGMGSDLFGSLAESTCAALIIASTAISEAAGSDDGPPKPPPPPNPSTIPLLGDTWHGIMYPVAISSAGIIVGMVTIYLVSIFKRVRSLPGIERALKSLLEHSTVLQSLVILGISYVFLPEKFIISNFGIVYWYQSMICVLLGLWSGLVIGYFTEYYTSPSYSPVREISGTQQVSAATGIIYGLALGYMSVIVPVGCLTLSICISHQLNGFFGIALSAIGMLSTLTIGLTIDAFGPICDNAGGLAEMANLPPKVRIACDALDSAGNTTAAIGKGFAIGSAAYVSLALFGAFIIRAKITYVDIIDPWTFTGLLFGAMIPYVFSALILKSVGIAATEMVSECMRQFPGIMEKGEEPNYTRCIEISTKASLRQMIAPGVLVIGLPLASGLLLGKNCTSGLLAGILVSGIQLAIASANAGGAWDNAKKYIESGALGDGHGKGSATHRNSVIGDTVGDPLKDASGPSINILIKLSAITSLVFGSIIANDFSNPNGGPWWL